jgi:DNA-binding NarL/FixJ family response regulator
MQAEEILTEVRVTAAPQPAVQRVSAVPLALRDSRARVLVVEDHPVYRDGLRALLESAETFELAGEADTMAHALTLARFAQPDLILLDVELSGVKGLDYVSQLRRACPKAKIAILTGQHEPEYLTTAVRLGVEAYLPKAMTGPAILNALTSVMNGERVLGHPSAITALLNELTELMQERERERLRLTEQEMEILRLAAAGLNNKEIGARQYWSEITVKRKMRQVYTKLTVKTRAQAVAEAIRLGFI